MQPLQRQAEPCDDLHGLALERLPQLGFKPAEIESRNRPGGGLQFLRRFLGPVLHQLGDFLAGRFLWRLKQDNYLPALSLQLESVRACLSLRKRAEERCTLLRIVLLGRRDQP